MKTRLTPYYINLAYDAYLGPSGNCLKRLHLSACHKGSIED